MNHAQARDRLAKEHRILWFEVEAAKQWQGYAALTAAAYAKVIPLEVPLNRIKKQRTRKACWMVPFDRNPRFLGRDSELQDLEKMIFSEGKSNKRAAITGLGGIGGTRASLPSPR
jgi:hypothetical protein